MNRLVRGHIISMCARIAAKTFVKAVEKTAGKTPKLQKH